MITVLAEPAPGAVRSSPRSQSDGVPAMVTAVIGRAHCVVEGTTDTVSSMTGRPGIARARFAHEHALAHEDAAALADPMRAAR